MKSRKLLSFVALAVVVVFAGACSDDDNPTSVPEFGTVSGRVTFDGTWPAVGNIQVSLFDVWPPAGPPYQASPVIAANSTTFDFKFEGLAKKTYAAIAVGWRNPANPTGARVLGIYVNDASKTGVTVNGGQPTFDTPVPIVISDAKIVWNGLDIKADLSLAQ